MVSTVASLIGVGKFFGPYTGDIGSFPHIASKPQTNLMVILTAFQILG